MKKLIAIFAVLLFVAPAFAADWAFYGSQRIQTFYQDRDYGNVANNVNGQSDDQGTQWNFQGNSRLGAKVKANKITGQIELALGAGGDGADTSVATRRAYGQWAFSDNAFLKVGKDYSPVTDFISNQWWGGDNDMLGEGNFYGRRPAGITLGIAGFEIAFLTPSYGGDYAATSSTTNTTGINGVTATATGGSDPDSYIPRVEAGYMLKLGPGYIKPFGGFQYYTVESTGLGNVTDDLDVLSWVLGVSTSWNIGAFSIGGQLSYGANQGNVTGWATGQNARASSAATLKNGDDIDNSYTLQALIVPALKVTDTLRFEAGIGYRSDDPDVDNAKKDELVGGYVQAMITLAPGVFLCPEVGYYDYMDNTAGLSQGSLLYAGAKWQIDF